MIAGSWIPGTARAGTPFRCSFRYQLCGDVLAIRDGDAGRPVWDAAGEVLFVLVQRGFALDRLRIVYRDSDDGDLWHGLLVVREGTEQCFAGRYPIGARDLEQAVQHARAGTP
jgi:hypothetical protein